MPYQSGRNIAVSYGIESVFGTAPAQAAASKVLRINSGGTTLTKGTVDSNENRRDLLTTRSRHGSRMVQGSYPIDLSLGQADDLLQAAFRGTFDTPLAPASTSVAADSATKTFTRSTGSFLTDGIRVGDVIRWAGFAGAGAPNNAKNYRVTAVTALVVTVAEVVATIAAAAGVSFSRPKKLLNGSVARSFTFEENDLDIATSLLFSGVRVGGFNINLAPNGMCVVTFNLVGQDGKQVSGGQSPYFTAAANTTGVGMTAVEALIRLGSGDEAAVTALDLTFDLSAGGMPVVGSLLTPEVFTNLVKVTGTVTMLKPDSTRYANFINEDQLSLHLLFTEFEAEPKDFCSFFIGNLTLGSATPSEIGGDNGRTQALALLVGADDRGGAYDAGMIKYQTSAV